MTVQAGDVKSAMLPSSVRKAGAMAPWTMARLSATRITRRPPRIP
jgi:hypothetical protein